MSLVRVREHGGVPGVIAFDLDLTLVDTRPGIHAALTALAAQTGRPIDADAIVAALGPPVADVLAPWFQDDELTDAVEAFRTHMARVGVMNVAPLPGAHAALLAARAAGHSVVVITSKIERLALATLKHAGLDADSVFGDVWAEGKAQPLRDSHANVYIGDHPADMVAARLAGVVGIGVATGSATATDLSAAGATTVLETLEAFPDWLHAEETTRLV